ncbi:exodeoxyribonuclease VII small subunit [Eggerthellaceae bacterium zg-1084]|uniref:Exodeoxyribonuclease VII small subunit n=1 Tax=Berryella wangjianweii TaxID=2734634 RepID=A0A6M8J875_9ACTN|nr:exodeoxyribonuclease VII small subunit [Berryella wangjianweii]NPD31708.1 exodeoxyribonuclease VII small subunit [Eggerthellaceae bacterium zg-997]QKF08046.1 exodeoxyribonuclease VII small subunit [Berryella wangjianweii]
MAQRLNRIVEAVGDESLPLDEALKLYEEAVSLGLQAGDLLEDGLDATDERDALEAELTEVGGASIGDEQTTTSGTAEAGESVEGAARTA